MDPNEHQSNILYREGLDDTLADDFIFCLFSSGDNRGLIYHAWILRYPFSENISGVIGKRGKRHLFKDCLIKLQCLANI